MWAAHLVEVGGKLWTIDGLAQGHGCSPLGGRAATSVTLGPPCRAQRRQCVRLVLGPNASCAFRLRTYKQVKSSTCSASTKTRRKSFTRSVSRSAPIQLLYCPPKHGLAQGRAAGGGQPDAWSSGPAELGRAVGLDESYFAPGACAANGLGNCLAHQRHRVVLELC
jgi:hypothetical protein